MKWSCEPTARQPITSLLNLHYVGVLYYKVLLNKLIFIYW